MDNQNIKSLTDSKVTLTTKVALAFAQSLRNNCGAIDLSIFERPINSAFKPLCALAFEDQAGKNIFLLVDHRLLYWICNCLGGGHRVPTQPILNKSLTLTELVLVEGLGLVTNGLLPQSNKLKFVGVGRLTKEFAANSFPDLKLFNLSSSEDSKIGCLAISHQFGQTTSSISLSFNAGSADTESFRVADPSALWDLARGRIADLSIDALQQWVHQETPQVAAVILTLAGIEKTIGVCQNKDSYALLIDEILLRIFHAKEPSLLLGQAIATQAAIYLEKYCALSASANEVRGVGVIERLDGKTRERVISSIEDRDSSLGKKIRASLSAHVIKIRKVGR